MARRRYFRGRFFCGLDLTSWRVDTRIDPSVLARHMGISPSDPSRFERRLQIRNLELLDRYVRGLLDAQRARLPELDGFIPIHLGRPKSRKPRSANEISATAMRHGTESIAHLVSFSKSVPALRAASTSRPQTDRLRPGRYTAAHVSTADLSPESQQS